MYFLEIDGQRVRHCRVGDVCSTIAQDKRSSLVVRELVGVRKRIAREKRAAAYRGASDAGDAFGARAIVTRDLGTGARRERHGAGLCATGMLLPLGLGRRLRRRVTATLEDAGGSVGGESNGGSGSSYQTDVTRSGREEVCSVAEDGRPS